jgi:hypothetical protein
MEDIYEIPKTIRDPLIRDPYGPSGCADDCGMCVSCLAGAILREEPLCRLDKAPFGMVTLTASASTPPGVREAAQRRWIEKFENEPVCPTCESEQQWNSRASELLADPEIHREVTLGLLRHQADPGAYLEAVASEIDRATHQADPAAYLKARVRKLPNEPEPQFTALQHFSDDACDDDAVDGDMCWWWLSFCDISKPRGFQFLGVAIVGPAHDLSCAVSLAWARGCNPGGQVLARKISIEHVPVADRFRLLTSDDCDRIDILNGKEVH